ncbi:Maf family protein [Pelagibaculum spongiae]|uniref:dTTP/UTP pyrophosphatase n=1 Tax=Pelagibaculum spongiae TaxID=2080658 RepID=A0A2V1H682_9GAMM|nr:Maf family protein [Pelagibaculum spongiae]PVZ71932.1 septum formation protein Maf [Pelagibaculum spongiae]
MNQLSDFCLASSSPRRVELLKSIGLEFAQLAADIDETPRPSEPSEEYVLRMAIEKAQAVLPKLEIKMPVLAADTSVILDGKILGKPIGREDAFSIWRGLSGRNHQVVSAVALTDGQQLLSQISVTKVRFKVLTQAEMEYYWNTGEPADKAGGYGIQGLGGIFVEHIEGSYSGVVGLPLFETCNLLKEFKICQVG